MPPTSPKAYRQIVELEEPSNFAADNPASARSTGEQDA